MNGSERYSDGRGDVRRGSEARRDGHHGHLAVQGLVSCASASLLVLFPFDFMKHVHTTHVSLVRIAFLAFKTV
jgi:hypothetical protein